MRPARWMAAIGSFAAAAALLLPSLEADGAAVEAATGRGIAWIWGTLSVGEQWALGALAALVVVAALLSRRWRPAGAVAVGAALAGGALVWFARREAVEAAVGLRDAVGKPVTAGWGYWAAIGAFGIAALASLISLAGGRRRPGSREVLAATGEDPPPRYLDVVIVPGESGSE